MLCDPFYKSRGLNGSLRVCHRTALRILESILQPGYSTVCLNIQSLAYELAPKDDIWKKELIPVGHVSVEERMMLS